MAFELAAQMSVIGEVPCVAGGGLRECADGPLARRNGAFGLPSSNVGRITPLGVFLSYSVKWFFEKVSEIRRWSSTRY